MKNVAFHNLGCKVNSYELDVMQQTLQKAGYNIVQFTQKADVYIVNTCTVTNIADRKSRQMLHRAKQLNPEAVVVAVGCYVQTGREQLENDSAVDIIIGNNHKSEVADILDNYFKELEAKKDSSCTSNTERIFEAVVSDLNQPVLYEDAKLDGQSNRTRADVKIQDGCNQFCAYCAIPLARGRVRSRKPSEILEEIDGLIKSGYKEIVLTGIHISSYGIDFADEAWLRGEIDYSKHESSQDGSLVRDYRGESKLIDLLSIIEGNLSDTASFRIRLGSLEPRIVTQENVDRMVGMKHLCPHFHLSLQSGCDETLKRMNRRYTAEEYAKSVDRLRNAYEAVGISAAITTDVIVGFPGETAEEFEITRKYLEDLHLYEMHIFKYSRRKNTVADKLPNQVADEVKDSRSDILLAMTDKHSIEYRTALLDSKAKVLFEEVKQIDGASYLIGHTGDYVKIAVLCEDIADDTCNKCVTVGNDEERTVLYTEELIGEIYSIYIKERLKDDTLLGIILKD